jgi:hypothetical protein
MDMMKQMIKHVLNIILKHYVVHGHVIIQHVHKDNFHLNQTLNNKQISYKIHLCFGVNRLISNDIFIFESISSFYRNIFFEVGTFILLNQCLKFNEKIIYNKGK